MLSHIKLLPKEAVVFPHIFDYILVLRDGAPLTSQIPTAKGRAYMRAQRLHRVLTSPALDVLTSRPKTAAQISSPGPDILTS